MVLPPRRRNPSGQEDYENLRKISLQTVDCILFAFSVGSTADLKLLGSYVFVLRSSTARCGARIQQKPSKYFSSPNRIPLPRNCSLRWRASG